MERFEMMLPLEAALPTFYIVGTSPTLSALFKHNKYVEVFDQDDADFLVFTGPSHVSINPYLYGQGRHENIRLNFRHELDSIAKLRKSRPSSSVVKIGIGYGAHLLNTLVGNGSSYQNVDGHTQGHDVSDVESKKLIHVPSNHKDLMIPGTDGKVLLVSDRVTQYETDCTTRSKKDEDSWREAEAILYLDSNTLCVQPEVGSTGGFETDICKWLFDTLDSYFLNTRQSSAIKKLQMKEKLN